MFISHASEDKSEVALPLARRLEQEGLRVWIDTLELTLGDSLRRSIDRGLARSAFGVVVLSPAFFGKEWPGRELDGLLAREESGGKVILPVWHHVRREDVVQFSPILAGKMAISTARGLDAVAAEVVRAVRVSAAGASAAPEAVDHAAEELGTIRRAMLTESSAWELRRHRFKVEDFLRRYPQHPEGRLLHAQILSALDYAEAPRPRAAPAGRAPAGSKVGFVAAVILAILAALAALLFGR